MDPESNSSVLTGETLARKMEGKGMRRTKKEAETGVAWAQDKECLELAGKKGKERLSLRAFTETLVMLKF